MGKYTANGDTAIKTQQKNGNGAARCVTPMNRILVNMAYRYTTRLTPAKRSPRIDKRHALCPLTPDQIRAIRAEYKPRIVTYLMLAEKYGVSESTIGNVLSGITGAHII